MAETTIEWTRGPRGEPGYTFNGWIGCEKISDGCLNCYAAAQDKFRSWTPEGWGGPRKRTSEANWRKPKTWNAAAAAAGERRKVFCSSLADVFDNQVPDEWRADLFDLIDSTPNLDWLLLTKRIGNAAPMLKAARRLRLGVDAQGIHVHPRPNVWIGATVVNQEEADRDIPKLLATPARVRFLSMEPLLGPVNLSAHLKPVCCGNPSVDHGGEYMGTCEVVLTCCGNPDPSPLDWVIVGGESGAGARPMQPDWARSLRDQCAAAGVPFLFKQWGEWAPRGPESMGYPIVDGVPRVRLTDAGQNGSDLAAAGGNDVWMNRAGKKAAGRELDGRIHDGFPEVAHG